MGLVPVQHVTEQTDHPQEKGFCSSGPEVSSFQSPLISRAVTHMHSPGSDLMASVLLCTAHGRASRARHCYRLMGGSGVQLALSKAGIILDMARA